MKQKNPFPKNHTHMRVECTLQFTNSTLLFNSENFNTLLCPASNFCIFNYGIHRVLRIFCISIYFSIYCESSITSRNPHCLYVSVQVYDGKEGSAPLLGTYTGMMMQGLFLTSTSNYLWLEFSSDQEMTAAGFQLMYHSKSHFI